MFKGAYILVVLVACTPPLVAGERSEREYTGVRQLTSVDIFDDGWEFSGRGGYLVSPFDGIESEGAYAGARAYYKLFRFDVDYLLVQSLTDTDTSKNKTSFLSASAGIELPFFEWLWFTPYFGGAILSTESPVGGDNGEDMGGLLGIAADVYISPELRFSASYTRHMYEDHDRLDDLAVTASISTSRIFDLWAYPDLRVDLGMRGFHGPFERISENYLVIGLVIVF